MNSAEVEKAHEVKNHKIMVILNEIKELEKEIPLHSLNTTAGIKAVEGLLDDILSKHQQVIAIGLESLSQKLDSHRVTVNNHKATILAKKEELVDTPCERAAHNLKKWGIVATDKQRLQDNIFTIIDDDQIHQWYLNAHPFQRSALQKKITDWIESQLHSDRRLLMFSKPQEACLIKKFKPLEKAIFLSWLREINNNQELLHHALKVK